MGTAERATKKGVGVEEPENFGIRSVECQVEN